MDELEIEEAIMKLKNDAVAVIISARKLMDIKLTAEDLIKELKENHPHIYANPRTKKLRKLIKEYEDQSRELVLATTIINNKKSY